MLSAAAPRVGVLQRNPGHLLLPVLLGGLAVEPSRQLIRKTQALQRDHLRDAGTPL